MTDDLVSLTGVTGSDELLDELAKTRPMIRATDKLAGLKNAKVAGCDAVMTSRQDFTLDIDVIWNRNSAVKVQ
jgi:hypothetical protein